ncbi:hypothetical protein IE81DRAFT_321570 [Ceraceosorus guamensis]|uniref:DUF938-domain-containing protein n=1 Tax=Ceraceosorus guamensis TaxID=1522189 RepID=A0A316W398_9BASI|nr:hypothetical protein IE81DRAFT_321570 [Ceraceosorus guamensis]PWN44169.1 hypothetical protein IE81DRAFT_321570 [Ceraceosorus guamensis]
MKQRAHAEVARVEEVCKYKYRDRWSQPGSASRTKQDILPHFLQLLDDSRRSRRALGPSNSALHVLEVSSGFGEHICHFAQSQLPDAASTAAVHQASRDTTFQPTEADEYLCQSIDRLVEQSRTSNIFPAIQLELTNAAEWAQLRSATTQRREGEAAETGIALFDIVLCFNIIHIAPWHVAECIFAQLGQEISSDSLSFGPGTHQEPVPKSFLAPGGLLVLYGAFKENGKHTSEGNAQVRHASLAYTIRVKALDRRSRPHDAQNGRLPTIRCRKLTRAFYPNLACA